MSSVASFRRQTPALSSCRPGSLPHRDPLAEIEERLARIEARQRDMDAALAFIVGAFMTAHGRPDE